MSTLQHHDDDLALELALRLEHLALPGEWEDSQTIARWGVELLVRDGDGLNAVIGTASLVVVDVRRATDLVYDLDWLSGDLAQLGLALERIVPTDEYRFWEGSRVVLAADVVLHPHWRGRGLGPRLLEAASCALAGIVGIILTPAGLPTVCAADGVWHSDYNGKRSAAATAKVRRAWKEAGYVRRGGTEYYLALDDDQAPAMTALLTTKLSKADHDWWRSRSSGG